jgi:hypothetical protein
LNGTLSNRGYPEECSENVTLPQRIYHLAEGSNWSSIQREGLLSASRRRRLADRPVVRASDATDDRPATMSAITERQHL